MLKRFLSYYKPQMGLFVADTVCALVLAAIDLAFPIILRNLTGGLFTQGQAAIMQALGMIAVGLVLMYAVRCACRYFVSYWGHVMGARMESKMREDLFDQYERFSFAYFDRNSSGDMMSRVVNDLFDICEAAHHVPEWIIICGIEIIGSFAILFTIAPVLALAMAVVTAAFAVIMFWQNMRMREVFSDNRKKISGINAQLQDSLAGMRVVKSFANEETERAKFRASNDRYLSSKENMYHAMGVYTATYGLLSGVLYVIVVLLGGWLVAQGQLQAVDMATFALYISLFCTPLETLVNSAETYQKAIAGFKRMDEVLSTAPDIQDKPGATDLQVTAGAVEYHDVCFNYEDVELGEGYADERPVIDHMNLSIKPGQTIALVGPSGGGKSTTCSLLPRFYAELHEKILSEECAWKGKILDVHRLEVELPNGRRSARDIVRHPGAAAVVALTESGKIVLVRQYRTAIDRVTVEIPAGKLDPGEDPLDCAKRELHEETGFRAGRIRFLTSIVTSCGFCDEIIHIYLATKLEFDAPNPDDDEFVNVDLVPLHELIDAVLDGKIEDAKTVVGALACDSIAHRLGGTEL